jgi:branched-chain amino acid transport system permease protein
VLFLLLLPQQITAGRVSLASAVMIYGMLGISMVILTGWSGNVSLGHWAIVGVGALVAGKLGSQNSPPDFFICVGAGALAGTLTAVLIGLPALRIRGLFLGVTTLAFAVAAGNWIFKFSILTPDGAILRPVLFGRFDTARERSFYYVCLTGLLLALLIGRNLRNSRFGRVLIGMRDNERQAQAYGVGIIRAKLSAFAASGFIAALAGALYAFQQQSIRADRFPADVSILIFSMVVIGGMGSLSGALLGAVYIRGTQYFLPSQFQPLVTGVGLLFLLLFFPGGLGQLTYMLRDKYLRWVANRRQLLVPSLVADKRAAAHDDEEAAVEAAVAAHPELATIGGDL